MHLNSADQGSTIRQPNSFTPPNARTSYKKRIASLQSSSYTFPSDLLHTSLDKRDTSPLSSSSSGSTSKLVEKSTIETELPPLVKTTKPSTLFLTYKSLIQLAIAQHKGSATLDEIFQWIKLQYSSQFIEKWRNGASLQNISESDIDLDAKWKALNNSIRHTLSVNKCFTKKTSPENTPLTQPKPRILEKGGKWFDTEMGTEEPQYRIVSHSKETSSYHRKRKKESSSRLPGKKLKTPEPSQDKGKAEEANPANTPTSIDTLKESLFELPLSTAGIWDTHSQMLTISLESFFEYPDTPS